MATTKTRGSSPSPPAGGIEAVAPRGVLSHQQRLRRDHQRIVPQVQQRERFAVADRGRNPNQANASELQRHLSGHCCTVTLLLRRRGSPVE